MYSLNASEGEVFTQIPTQNIEIPIGETELDEVFCKPQRADTEQRIQDCGQTIVNLTGLSDAEMVGMADSVEAARDRREGRLVG